MEVFGPATREKFQRFRKMKRAWWSFLLLILIFVISLFSELVANPTPWLLRFEGKLYFPRLRVVNQDLFLGDGVKTVPDFHDLDASELFTEEKGNWMLWAPIPFGPKQTLEAGEIEVDPRMQLTRRRNQRVSSIRVNAKFATRADPGSEWFFPQGDPEIPEALRGALSRRFANRSSEAMEVKDPSGKFTWYLSAYDARSRAPRTLRLIVRENLGEILPEPVLLLAEGDEAYPEWWNTLPDDVRIRAEQGRINAATIPVDPVGYTDAEDRSWEILISRETVQFPFRPVKNHPLGLDKSGRDVLTLLLYATRISLLFGFILVFCSMLVGTILGGLQGYFGGKVDMIAQRLIEIYSAIPFLYAMIYLGSVFGTSFGLLLFVYAIFNWIGISYYMRAEFLKLRKQPFTEAAHSLGLPTGRIMWRHILPNALVPLITFFPFSLVGAIGSLSALDFLGFGLPVGTPSWGGLLSQAQEYRFAWWLIVYPALALFVVILLGVFIGEGLRSAFDPKRETHWEA
ncbi:ABC transporter permease subunit [Kiritimatiellaeota bacterium B1221]|nr:ABC transporter permease subunit [Kiritimatiellaeota bacterium B1221]